MRKNAIAAASIVAALSAELSSAAFFSDSFDGRAGALTGQVADSGQTWGNFTYFGSYPSFSVGTEYGANGAEGAGTKDEYTFAGNSVSFNQVSSGAVRFELDLTTRGPHPYYSSTTPLKQFFLLDTAHSTGASIYWQQRDQTIAFEGLGFSDPGQATGQALQANATMHVILDIDLTNKTVQYSWSGLNYDQPDNTFSGSKNLGTYSVDFAPNDLQIWGRGQSSVIASGYDNIVFDNAPVPVPEWNLNGDGSWSAAGNWSGPVPNAIDASAKFGSVITQARAVTVDVPVTVGNVEFANANTYTLSGVSALTLDVSSGNAAINVTAGSHVIDAPIVLAKDTMVSVTGGGALSVQSVRGAGLNVASGAMKITAKGTANDAAGTSKVTSLTIDTDATLDLANNSLVIDYTGTSVQDDVRQALADGRLTSSSADANRKLGYGEASVTGFANGTFAGQAVDADAVLVKFTYGGDSNLDGKVDVGDLGNLASNWQQSAPWTGGDFDYNGSVNVGDLGILATNWQQGVTTPTLGPSFAEALAALGLGGVSVPEPTALGLIGLAATVGLRKRRRIAC